MRIVRRTADGREISREELKALVVTTPAVENAVRQAALRRAETEGVEG